jgi:outer membrane PBP1 activator LpoA protein
MNIFKPVRSRFAKRTRMHMPGSAAVGLAVLVAFVATGCTSMQPTDTQPTASTARKMAAEGDHVSASREYLNLAVNSKGDQRQRYLIFAMGELYLANDLDGAERIMNQIGTDIADSNLEVWAEITAVFQLARNEPEAALAALNRVTSTANKVTASRILTLRSDALFQLDRPEAAVLNLLKREGLLTSNEAIEGNRRLIWSGLQTAGPAINPDTEQTRQDPVLAGWMQLGYLAYINRSSIGKLRESLSEWQQRYPGHPASGKLLEDVLANLGALSNYPDRVALLLPLSGPQQAIGEAIRDGFMAAHYDLGAETARPEVFVYDTARNGAAAAFQNAILNGTGFVVGPLLKDEIAEVAAIADGVTLLALNYVTLETESNADIYQFALSPEDEARAVADRAADEGMLNAVALVPDNNWGERVLDAFRERLQQRGGTLLSARAYPTDAADFSQPIREILLLNESYARRDRLAANIGKTVEFEPRRRQDVDLVFLGANPTVAKLLKPQLRFHYAGGLPTFATSAIFQPGSENATDLNGIMFPDIPWLLDPDQTAQESQRTLERYWGATATRGARFYAMGYDAYYLTAILQGAPSRSAVLIEGMTGTLTLDKDGQLHRGLKWARIDRGQPRVLPDIPSSLSQEAEIVVSQQ